MVCLLQRVRAASNQERITQGHPGPASWLYPQCSWHLGHHGGKEDDSKGPRAAPLGWGLALTRLQHWGNTGVRCDGCHSSWAAVGPPGDTWLSHTENSKALPQRPRCLLEPAQKLTTERIENAGSGQHPATVLGTSRGLVLTLRDPHSLLTLAILPFLMWTPGKEVL